MIRAQTQITPSPGVLVTPQPCNLDRDLGADMTPTLETVQQEQDLGQL